MRPPINLRSRAPNLPTGRSDSAKRTGFARALSKLGYCSRSRAIQLIKAGRVRLNGAVTRNSEAPVRVARDRIEVDGRRIEAATKIYLVLNKPRGVVTTASDEKGRQTVYDYLGSLPNAEAEYVAPVGRLDKASEGLLLLTNDSEWAGRVLAPKTHLEKTYHVQVAAVANGALLGSLRQGVRDEGEFLRVKRVDAMRQGERNSWLVIVLDEGKNRQIRRMLNSLGVEVLRLVRVAIGPLELRNLPKGSSRSLSAAEKAAMDRALDSAAGRAVEGIAQHR